MTINIKGDLLAFDRALVMGILNITPDSFYANSRINPSDDIYQRIQKMFDDGADIIDIGSMSSRPGAKIITEKEEWSRLLPIFEVVLKEFPDKYFSIDTIRSIVAKRAVKDYGISMVNDISGGEYDNKMFETVADSKIPYITMHMIGQPENMQENTNYKSMLNEMIFYFAKKVEKLRSFGLNDIIIDPGFGFSKTIDQNFELLNNLKQFKIFELPLLVGLSRKSMIWKTLDTTSEKALNGTTVLNTIALTNGANILRVHDVREAKETIKLFHKTQISARTN